MTGPLTDSPVRGFRFPNLCVPRRTLGLERVVGKQAKKLKQAPTWKLILWTAVAGLVFGFIGFGEIAEDGLRSMRNDFHRHKASGDIALVLIDDKSLHEIGNWPWPREEDAKLIDGLTAAHAKQLFVDINLSFPTSKPQDEALAKSIEKAGMVTLFTRSQVGVLSASRKVDGRPLPIFADHSKLGLASFDYNYQSAVWRMPWSARVGNQVVPSFAAALAGKQGPVGESFRVDYSTRIDTIPIYSAVDVIQGRVNARQLAGKQVMVGTGSEILNDNFFVPGYGRAFGAQIHALAAETLKAGTPIDLGWLAALVLSLAASSLALAMHRPLARTGILAVSFAATLIVPIPLEANHIFVDITPSLFVLMVIAGVLVWRRYRRRGLVNPLSDLPNLSALRGDREGRNQAIVAARVLNYEEIVELLENR